MKLEFLSLLVEAGALAFALLSSGCATTDGRAQTLHRAEELMASAPVRTGDLSLHCNPEDATVEVDEVPMGTCADFDGDPKGLLLGEGMHRVVVRQPGYWPYQTYYQPSGAKAALDISLVPTGKTREAGP